MDRSEFLAEVFAGSGRLCSDQSNELRSVVDRRLSGEPLAYIVGRREFYGLTLRVDSRVLIPRQETELLVDIVLEHLERSHLHNPIVVDVGTGSGAIALAVASHADGVQVVATDISDDALVVASSNAERLGLSDMIEFASCDMLASIEGPIDVVVSNPPYIPDGDIAGLAVEVRREPHLALEGGDDGLDPLRRLLSHTAHRLAPNGVVVVELMPEQMRQAEALAVETLGHDVEIDVRRDLMGNERALVIKRLDNGVEGHGEGT